jgi:hypothetical protein
MFTLNQVVPWGRSFEEYRGMFALSDADLRGRVLGCADGPASFNAEATRRGTSIISADPLYRFDGEAIRERVTATHGQILDQMQSNMHEFLWDNIRSLDELGRLRMETMEAFLADYDAGKRDGRYIDAELPALAFPMDILMWLYARIFCFFIRSTSRKPFTAVPFWSYAVFPRRSGFFH